MQRENGAERMEVTPACRGAGDRAKAPLVEGSAVLC